LQESRLDLGGRLISSVVTQEDMRRLGAGEHDFEGIVNQLRYTAGVSVAAFLHETPDGAFKVSLRSNHEVDVAKVAAAFGGGGHIRAAGCTLQMPADEITGLLAREIQKQF
jgi:phosphoesterase RecJ-like protein